MRGGCRQFVGKVIIPVINDQVDQYPPQTTLHTGLLPAPPVGRQEGALNGRSSSGLQHYQWWLPQTAVLERKYRVI